MNENRSPDYVRLAAEIVSAFVTHTSVPISGIPALIADVHSALSKLSTVEAESVKPLVPAVPIKKSITPDYLISLEDGRRYKSLKRHLRTSYGMTPDQYRAKWGLPADYPMVAPNYAKTRSELAKSLGLGQRRKPAGRQRRKAA